MIGVAALRHKHIDGY